MEREPHISESELLDFFNDRLSAEEKRVILDWKASSEENRRLFEKVRKENLLLREVVRAKLLRGEYSAICSRVGHQRKGVVGRTQALYDRIIADGNMKEHLDLKSECNRQTDYGKSQSGILRSLTERNRQKRVKHYFLWRGSAAAVFILAGMLLFKYMKDAPVEMYPKKTEIAKTLPASETVQDKVVLVLADGKKVGMTKIEQDSLRVGTAVVIGREDKLVYASAGERADSLVPDKQEINKVITTTGGGYSLVLSDGTRVWLNSESELEFPVFFGRDERMVKLKGEAFFEVTPDVSRPFIVQTSGVRTRVLGTSFNVKSYPEEFDRQITLVEGRVKVISEQGNETVTLIPGEQAVLNTVDGRIVTRKVETDLYCAWHEGRLVFQNNTLEEILRILGRRCDLHVIWEDESLKTNLFSGELSTNSQVETLLKIIGYTGEVKFMVNGREVLVRRR